MRGSVSLDVDAREGRRGYPAASRSLHGASRFRKFNGSPRTFVASESVGSFPLEASRSSCRQAPLQVPAASMESLRITRAAVGTERRQAVSYSISTLLTRNLHDVFGENDPERRRAAIDDIFTEDGVFYDPSKGVYRGRDEIDRVAGAIRATHPDFRYQPIAGPEELGNGGRVPMVSGRPGEAPAYAGTDFIIARDGRIAALYLFLDKLP